jgi:GNAT superfamily N-acetyltransferase
MSAYRFCRTDDIGLLVDALNRCWGPYFPGEPATTTAAFKRSIRDLQVWCSSCMVAFSGPDPIGVLIGAKRPSGTLVHRIAVHPNHRRQGHGRHLLDSLGSKLAILGPPRIVAEVPEALTPARELFRASGYADEARLTDYEWVSEEAGALESAGAGARPERAPATSRLGYVIPATVDDLVANGLIGQDNPQTCWERSIETLTARKDDIAGLAIATDERIEASILYIEDGTDVEVVVLRSFFDDDGARLRQLLAPLGARGMRRLRLPKVHPAEFSGTLLETVGFRPIAGHRLYTATPAPGASPP